MRSRSAIVRSRSIRTACRSPPLRTGATIWTEATRGQQFPPQDMPSRLTGPRALRMLDLTSILRQSARYLDGGRGVSEGGQPSPKSPYESLRRGLPSRARTRRSPNRSGFSLLRSVAAPVRSRAPTAASPRIPDTLHPACADAGRSSICGFALGGSANLRIPRILVTRC